MNISSFEQDLNYNEKRIEIKLILESSFSKELRIVFNKGQVMKEHKAGYPIMVHVLDGKILFGVNGDQTLLEAGGIIALNAHTPHDLIAQEDSIVRLTLSKSDNADRVVQVVKESSKQFEK